MKYLMIFSILLVVFLALGCYEGPGYYNKTTGDIKTPDEFANLPEADKAGYVPAKIKAMSPQAVTTGDQAIKGTQDILTVVQPILPQPIATIVGVVFGIVAGIWGAVKKNAKQVLTYEDSIDSISAGGTITAKAIDELKIAAPDAWAKLSPLIDKYKADAASTGTAVIMPNEI
jgi:hypothetical protein